MAYGLENASIQGRAAYANQMINLPNAQSGGQVAPPTSLNRASAMIDGTNEQIASVLGRVQKIADVLCGNEPTPPDGTPKLSGSQSAVSSMIDRLQLGSSGLVTLMRQIDRIERIIG
jgi:hypothetical protein